MPRKIVFIVPHPSGQSPSQRFRFEQYFDLLKQKGFTLDVEPFLPPRFGKVFFQSGKLGLKLWIIVHGFIRRIGLVSIIRKYDFIFIHREATPIGPPIIEWMIKLLARGRIIYDFDDAIWLTDNTNEGRILEFLKWRSKVSSICKWADTISCGTPFLVAFGLRFNNKVYHVPSVLDTKNTHNPALFRKEGDHKVVIGWTGSHSTLKYLKLIEGVLLRIEETFNVEFRVIADRPPDLSLKKMKFVPWQRTSEVRDLISFDIGVMPLPDDEWSKGKGGFKLLQYMSLEIPVVASRIGANNTIVDESVNGFLCSSDQQWHDALSKLINDASLRKTMGIHGRTFVQERYSVEANYSAFFELFA